MKQTSTPNIDRLAKLLDTQFKGPFGLRFGLDGLLGLIPVAGDVITTALSSYIVIWAASQGVRGSILTRMIINILVENVVDAIPIVGNLFDFYWKANVKNLELLKKFQTDAPSTRKKSKAWIGFVVTLTLAILVSMIIGVIYLAIWALDILLSY